MMRRAALGALILLGASTVRAQESCQANPDSAAVLVADVTRSLEGMAPAGRVRWGFVDPPNAVTVVTDSAVCTSALAAFNLIGSAEGPAGKAFVLQVDSTAYVLVPIERKRREFVFFDRKFKVLFFMSELD